MKVVICQNCGEKYQLEDDEDVTNYECNVCRSNLEETTVNSKNNNIKTKNNTEVVYCEDCGLKYRIDSRDNIDEYECDSCGGELKYTDDSLNIKLIQTAKIPQHSNLNDLQNELNNIKLKNNNINVENEVIYPEHDSKAKNNNLNDNYEVTIYKYYGELKQELKREYLQHILETPYDGGMFDQISHRFRDKIKSNNIDLSYPELDTDNLVKNPKKDGSLNDYLGNLTQKEISIIAGTIITIVGLISILIINIGQSILILILGIILLVYGFYEQKEKKDLESEHVHVIRSKLLTLPKDYYVLYHVKTPGTNVAINHVVIGPTGIFTIITQRNSPHELSVNQNTMRPNEGKLRFRDELELKQKTLALNRILFGFLDENGFTIPIEPLIGFVSEDVAIINDILNDSDLFMDEVLHKITRGERKLDSTTIRKCAILLSHYSINCPN